MSEPPWKRHLVDIPDQTFEAHGLEFIVTRDEDRAEQSYTEGKAIFTRDEVSALRKLADKTGKIPKELSIALHSVKRILGGLVQ